MTRVSRKKEKEAAELLFQNEVQNESDTLPRKSTWTASPVSGLWCEERSKAVMVLTKDRTSLFNIYKMCDRNKAGPSLSQPRWSFRI
jgi:hypothetical protein